MKLYNSLTQKKETFKSLEENEVKMYICGITPYDTTHLGHAFTYTAFDVLYRYLTYQNYTVNYTQNITDIDDDILKRAKKVNQDWKVLGTLWTDKYVRDMQTLNNTPPTHFVKATGSIPTIIEIVQKLTNSNFAYEKNGNVYFRVQKDTEYGKLSKYNREQMITLSKERGANPEDPLKEDPLDFILWQKSLPQEPFWQSPWRRGRPGWHIECSAIVYKYLGKYIDIHGGGHDLIYPHHESEIALSEQFTGHKPFSKFWMHTGAVMYKGEKMSKSLGNLVMISDLLKTYSPNAIRYLLLSHHYRSAWEYHKEELDEVALTLYKIEKKLLINTNFKKKYNFNDIIPEFSSALADDLNTPKALEIFTHSVTNEKYPYKTIQMAELLGFKV